MGIPNTEGVPLTSFSEVRDGWYEGEFIGEEDGSGDKGTYTKVSCRVSDTSRRVEGYLSHAPQALFKIKQFKLAIGMKDEEEDLTPYIGAKLLIFVQNEPYNGEQRPKLQGFKPLGSKVKVQVHYEPESSTPAKDPDDDLPF